MIKSGHCYICGGEHDLHERGTSAYSLKICSRCDAGAVRVAHRCNRCSTSYAPSYKGQALCASCLVND